MSFRVFIYYCVVWGAATAFLGWMLGQIIQIESEGVYQTAIKGLALGMLVALGLAMVDAFAAGTPPATSALILRTVLALLIGAVGGWLGGFVGQGLYWLSSWSTLLVFGWTLTGFLIGFAPSMFDYLGALLRGEERRGTSRKLRNGLIGGVIGGFSGGLLSMLLHGAWGIVFKDPKALVVLWSPSSTGFVALGACIGLAVAMAQVILREAWLRVEAGFRPGRQVLLTRKETTIGRSEACDVGLFGDAAVDKVHAKIVREGDSWQLVDTGTASGTMLNGQRITGPTPLKMGDRIQVGGSVLSFGVRKKEAAAPTAAAPMAIPATP